MIAVMLRALLGWFGTAITTVFGGWKIFLVVTVMSFATVYFYNLISGLLQEALTFVTTQTNAAGVPSGMTSGYSFTGFAGYMLSVLKVPQCMAFIISVMSLKFMLRKIPFIKW